MGKRTRSRRAKYICVKYLFEECFLQAGLILSLTQRKTKQVFCSVVFQNINSFMDNISFVLRVLIIFVCRTKVLAIDFYVQSYSKVLAKLFGSFRITLQNFFSIWLVDSPKQREPGIKNVSGEQFRGFPCNVLK